MRRMRPVNEVQTIKYRFAIHQLWEGFVNVVVVDGKMNHSATARPTGFGDRHSEGVFTFHHRKLFFISASLSFNPLLVSRIHVRNRADKKWRRKRKLFLLK